MALTYGCAMSFRSRHTSSFQRFAPAVLVALSLVAFGCSDDLNTSGSSGTPTASDLSGSTFLSTDVQGQTLVDGTRITMQFSDGSLGTVAGCNTIAGSYSIEGDVLVMAAPAMTKMLCDEETSKQDAWLVQLLTSRPTISQKGDTLTFTSAAVTLTMRDRIAVATASAVDGSAWPIESLETAAGVTPAPTGAYLSFDGERMYIATGCNRGSGAVTVGTDNTIEVGPIILTKMACEAPLADWETALIGFLEGKLTYALSDTGLALTAGTDKLSLLTPL
jgi:heat shock protein HslJ